VRTDAIFYQLFKRFPSFLFSLTNQIPEQAKDYRFASVEIKETAFRIDGVFLPPENASNKTIFFAEFQCQSDEDLFHRFFSESLLYLYRNKVEYDDWYGVFIFSKRSLEPKDKNTHRSLLNSDQIQRIYLDELDGSAQQPIGVQLVRLITMSETETMAQAKRLVERTQSEEIPLFSKKEIIDLITTIAVYKFTNLSRQEVETMLGVRLEESRVYQEAKSEGITEGKAAGITEGKAAGITEGKAAGIVEGQLQEGRSLVIRQLKRRIGKVSSSLQSQIETLSLNEIEALGEALLDFTTEADLVTWLQSHS
jgi:predicted transposase/invertase (TIGR01784 family)